MLVYFISQSVAFNIGGDACNLRIQALEETDLQGLWHSQFLKNSTISQQNHINWFIGINT